MNLHLTAHDSGHSIRSCTRVGDSFRLAVGETAYCQSVIITPEAIELWAIKTVAELTENDFARLTRLTADVILLGTGTAAVFPAPALTQPLMVKNIGLEVMDTPAACRTYNILLADGRNPAAALMV